MICIIDGFKYDTTQSELITQVQLNKTDVCYLYRNRKLKYFCVITELVSIESMELKERCVPITKDDAKSFLADHNKVKEYEESFGEVPEAEGEDYIEAGSERISSESPENAPKPQLKRRYSLINTIRLSRAVKKNDSDAALSAISGGAKVKGKHLSGAVLRQNTDIVRLLLDAGAKPLLADYDNAILLDDMPLFQTLLSAHKLQRYEYGVLRRYADKFNREKFVACLADCMK